jgi:hypothetical protein
MKDVVVLQKNWGEYHIPSEAEMVTHSCIRDIEGDNSDRRTEQQSPMLHGVWQPKQ